MEIEYEATFANINKDEYRKKLKDLGAKLIKPDFLQKRTNFNLPKGHEINGGWVRLRDEGDKITLTLKVIDGNKIENQKEICFAVEDFEKTKEFLSNIGCQEKSYQETKREVWNLDGVEIMIDEWPFLEPYIEIEGKSEESVKNVAYKLGFDYSRAIFGSVITLYSKKYNKPVDFLSQYPKLIFGNENPFTK